ncbi:unnamed protein product [Penicillium nalgiovense]|nr:unnamed protein product [Penicillium nalgiovense]
MLFPWICQLPFTCPCFRLLFHMFEGILSIFDKSSASFPNRFELVFLILGNHEFYSDTFATGLQRARQLEKEHCFIGHCLFENTRLQKKISIGPRLVRDWSVNDHNGYHEADLAWLLSEIKSIQSPNKTQKQKQSKKQSVLVVTHHAPSLQGTSTPQHANNAWSSAFATDILSQISKSSGIKVWGIRVVANQRGYVLPWTDSKGSKDGFDIGKVIHL